MQAAGLPANFWQVNPDLIGGANIVGNGGYTRYNSLQLELRKRLSHGLQFQTSYVFGETYANEPLLAAVSARSDGRAPATEGGLTHAFSANWVYELPFGQGRRFGSGVGPWMDRLIGGWSFDGIARIQSGPKLDFGNVRLVGMTSDELQDAFKLRFDDAQQAGVHAAAGHHRQHGPGVQHQRDIRHRLQRSGRADGPLPRAGERSGLHRSRRPATRRLRRAPARGHRPTLVRFDLSTVEALRHQRQHRTSSSAPRC